MNHYAAIVVLALGARAHANGVTKLAQNSLDRGVVVAVWRGCAPRAVPNPTVLRR